MNRKKQYPNDKLQKSSFIFLQLGLILALLFVYSVLEAEYEKNEFALLEPSSELEPVIFPSIPQIIKIERPEKIKEPKRDTKPKIDPEKIIINDKGAKPESILPPDDLDNKDDLNKRISELPDFTDDEEDEKIESFTLVQRVPRFPGCELLDNDEAVACFTKNISRFVNRKFNTGLASTLGLEGRQNIYVQFVIDKNGDVRDIVTRAPHKALEKEAQRIVEKLPKMTPGMQQDKAVSVKYTLPIRFVVE